MRNIEMSAVLDALQLGPVRWQVWLGWSYLYSNQEDVFNEMLGIEVTPT